ncbi:MAG: hypothetical protein ACW99A_05135 [Candidatus Kariarchaeaceae archaeon]|jgi:hypothetical protein
MNSDIKKRINGLGIIFLFVYILLFQLIETGDNTLANNPRQVNDKNSVEGLIPLWINTKIGTQDVAINIATLIMGLALLITIFGVIHLTQRSEENE